jgi:hypothetical protein
MRGLAAFPARACAGAGDFAAAFRRQRGGSSRAAFQAAQVAEGGCVRVGGGAPLTEDSKTLSRGVALGAGHANLWCVGQLFELSPPVADQTFAFRLERLVRFCPPRHGRLFCQTRAASAPVA